MYDCMVSDVATSGFSLRPFGEQKRYPAERSRETQVNAEHTRVIRRRSSHRSFLSCTGIRALRMLPTKASTIEERVAASVRRHESCAVQLNMKNSTAWR